MGNVTKQKKIDNMIESLAAFPSFSQKLMGKDGKACLSNCVYRTSSCGCQIIGNGTLTNPLEIKFCKIHNTRKNS